MLYGKRRELPTPGARDECPGCGAELIAKCGDVVIWHWSHKNTDECDSWSEGTTKWHLDWQGLVPDHRREITLGPHRADMVLPSGHICEVQHSPMSWSEARRREAFYGKRLFWIIDAREAYWNGNFEERKMWSFNDKLYGSFWWKYKRKDGWGFRQPVFLDIGEPYLIKFEEFFDGQYWTPNFRFRGQCVERLDFKERFMIPHKSGRSLMAIYDAERDRVRWTPEREEIDTLEMAA